MSELTETTGDLIKHGAEIVAVEHEKMYKFASLQRRNPALAMEMALSELRAFPELAEKGYYSVPRKSKKCRHQAGQVCGDCIHIEGASVGATRVVARCWGNCTAGVRIAGETDDHWDLEGRWLDFETNFSSTRGLRLMKRVKWGGTIRHLSTMDPQMEQQLFQAGVSKCYRNAIRDGVPEAILDRYWKTAKEMVVGKKPTRKLTKAAVKKVLEAFAVLRVSPEMLEQKLGRTMDQWTAQDSGELRGLHTALEAGETSVLQIFGGDFADPEPEPVEAEVVEPEPAEEDKNAGLFEE